MPRRSSKAAKGEDINEAAFRTLQGVTREEEDTPEAPPAKNPAAVELGRLGGRKGGKARAEKLSKKQRSEIAKKAAEARWKKQKGGS